MAATVRIGTCSWADESLVKYWYPREIRSSEDRLRYYADRFDTVEIDSTYYRLPEAENARKWAERTPDGFLFHVKAFRMMTRHPVKLEQLPPELREGAPTDERGRVDRPPRDFRGEVFRLFHDALAPLRDAGKLGGILLQFPSYIVYKPASLEYLEWAKEQLGDDEMLVEFRHSSWLADENRQETLRLLERLGAAHVVVDAPRIEGARNLVPTVPALTSPTLYVRFHGRNAETWNKRGGGAQERFDYLYPKEELREWVEPLRELAGDSEQAFAMMNTNKWSSDGLGGTIPQGAANAQALRAILEEEGVPVTPPAVTGLV